MYFLNWIFSKISSFFTNVWHWLYFSSHHRKEPNGPVWPALDDDQSAQAEQSLDIPLPSPLNDVVVNESNNSSECLHDKAKRGDNAEIIEWLNTNMDKNTGLSILNSSDSTGRTVLHWSISRKKWAATEALLANNGINVDIVDSNGKTALAHALEQNAPEGIIIGLIGKSKSLDVRCKWGSRGIYTILTSFVRKDQKNVVRALLEHKDGLIILNTADKTGSTAISWAIFDRKWEIAQFLLSFDRINIDIVDSNGKTALDYALERETPFDLILQILERKYTSVDLALIEFISVGRWDIVQKLLEGVVNINVDIVDSNGKTALAHALEQNAPEDIAVTIAQKTRNLGVVYKTQSFNGETTPLIHAVRLKQKGIVSALLDHDYTGNDSGNIAITWAIFDRNWDMTKFLLDFDRINIDIPDDHGKTALYWALKRKASEDIVIGLIKKAKKLNVHGGFSPSGTLTLLMHAIRLKQEGVIRALLDHADCASIVNAVDDTGKTALSKAILDSNWDVVRLLLNVDAINVAISDSNDKTALDYALEKSIPFAPNDIVVSLIKRQYQYLHIALIEFIKAQKWEQLYIILGVDGINIDIPDDHGKTVLYYALEQNAPEFVVTDLIKEAKRLDVHGESSPSATSTLLMHAIRSRQEGRVIRALLDHADCASIVNAVDDTGETALSKAILASNWGVVRLLLNVDAINVAISDSNGKTALDYVLEQNAPEDIINLSKLKFGLQNIDVLVEKGEQEIEALFAISPDSLWEHAIQNNNKKLFAILLKIDHSLVTKIERYTPLIISAGYGREYMVSTIVNSLKNHEKFKNFLNAAADDGLTALHCAIGNEQWEIAGLLLSVEGIDVTIGDEHNETPLFYALSGNAPIDIITSILRLCSKLSLDIAFRDLQSYRKWGYIKTLLAADAELSIEDETYTVLYVEAINELEEGYVDEEEKNVLREVIELLRPKVDKMEALLYSLQKGYEKASDTIFIAVNEFSNSRGRRILFGKELRTLEINPDNTPLDSSKLISRVASFWYDLNKTDLQGRTAFELATERGYYELAGKILLLGAADIGTVSVEQLNHILEAEFRVNGEIMGLYLLAENEIRQLFLNLIGNASIDDEPKQIENAAKLLLTQKVNLQGISVDKLKEIIVKLIIMGKIEAAKQLSDNMSEEYIMELGQVKILQDFSQGNTGPDARGTALFSAIDGNYTGIINYLLRDSEFRKGLHTPHAFLALAWSINSGRGDLAELMLQNPYYIPDVCAEGRVVLVEQAIEKNLFTVAKSLLSIKEYCKPLELEQKKAMQRAKNEVNYDDLQQTIEVPACPVGILTLKELERRQHNLARTAMPMDLAANVYNTEVVATLAAAKVQLQQLEMIPG
jgi:ankyrin repeat protein